MVSRDTIMSERLLRPHPQQQSPFLLDKQQQYHLHRPHHHHCGDANDDAWKGHMIISPKSIQGLDEDEAGNNFQAADVIASRPQQHQDDGDCVKKRIHDDVPLANDLEPKKTCISSSSDEQQQQQRHEDDNENAADDKSACGRQNRHWIQKLQQLQNCGLSVLEMVAESGSIEDFLSLLEYLFETHRVETFTLDLIVEFWAIFPEAANDRLLRPLFPRYQCWQQLLLLLERAPLIGSTIRLKQNIWNACLALLKDQWTADMHASSITAKKKNRSSTAAIVSELAVWLPRGTKRKTVDDNSSSSSSDFPRQFVRRFARILYPKSKVPSEARERYKTQLRALREAAAASIQTKNKNRTSGPFSHKLPSSLSSDSRRADLVLVGSPLSKERSSSKIKNSPTRTASRQQQSRSRSSIPSFHHISLYNTLLSFSPPHYGGTKAKATNETTTTITQHGLLLPTEGRVDQFLYLQPAFRTASEAFLRRQPIRSFDRSSPERILYIHQGELGYATPSQCDIILSDKATTCHILSIQSTICPSSSSSLSSFSRKIIREEDRTLTSLAHIDASCYTECLMEMIETHVRYHGQSEEGSGEEIHQTKQQQQQSTPPNGCKTKKIQLIVDMVGGFDDDRGASAEISSWLFEALAYLAEEHQQVLTMTIRTCAVSYMNNHDDVESGNPSPIGRGMGVDLRTGEVFLARADDASVVGPASQLRSARIWSGGGKGRLAVVHYHHHHPHTSGNNRNDMNNNELFVIQPFRFGVFDQLDNYLRMPDSKMILRTSTSPDVEEPDFCDDVRNTLRFMKGVDCHRVFGPNLDQAMVFRRQVVVPVGAGSSSNVWTRHCDDL